MSKLFVWVGAMCGKPLLNFWINAMTIEKYESNATGDHHDLLMFNIP